MNYEGKWIRVTECDNIPLREGRAVRFGELEIAVFNLGSRFLAVENRCPHLGGPLSDGIVSGESVVCPLHAWKIGLEDGTVERPMDMAKCVTTFATRIENGTVLLQVPCELNCSIPISGHVGGYCAQRPEPNQEELSA